MASKTKTARTTRRTKAKHCVHHWVIESPNGRESVGICKHCSTEKSFQNSNEQVMWEQTNTIRNHNAVRVRRPQASGLSDELE